jgi:hypothetical protein
MPITYSIDKSRKFISTRCAGDVTLAEVLDHFRVLERDPECPDRLDVLLDLRDMTSLPTTADLRRVGDQIGRVKYRVKFGACAVVAPSDLLFGVSRMFEAFSEQHFGAMHVSRDCEGAQAWLASRVSSKPE